MAHHVLSTMSVPQCSQDPPIQSLTCDFPAHQLDANNVTSIADDVCYKLPSHYREAEGCDLRSGYISVATIQQRRAAVRVENDLLQGARPVRTTMSSYNARRWSDARLGFQRSDAQRQEMGLTNMIFDTWCIDRLVVRDPTST